MSQAHVSGNAWGISAGSLSWAAHSVPAAAGAQPLERRATDKHAALSVLLPRLPGEPPRIDYWRPPHPRGSGEAWPPEARVSARTGAGRFPLAAAWSGRSDGLSWTWSFDGNEYSMTSIGAIATGLSEVAFAQGRTEPLSLVIPNDFREREQQAVLDACSRKGMQASLLWLPIAASLSWLAKFEETLPPPQRNSESTPKIAVVHADWARVTCSVIPFSPWPTSAPERWVPTRRRPHLTDTVLPGFGWSSFSRCDERLLPDIWRRLFTSSLEQNPPQRVAWGSSSCHTLPELLLDWQLQQTSLEEADSLLTHRLRELSPELSGIVVVGDFAATLADANQFSLARSVDLSRQAQSRCVIAAGAEGEAFLAKGAATFAKDQQIERTSYLDTLPDIELCVDRMEQYEWLSLLGDSEAFVEGGKRWDRPEPITGLAVRRGAAQIKLVVAHEEYEGVRQLNARLNKPAEQRLSATLRVSTIPAQGNAKLRLETVSEGDIPRRSILANWQHMEPVRDSNNNLIDKDAYIAMQPRAFPELLPRRSSASKWRLAQPAVEKLISRMEHQSPTAILQDIQFLRSLRDRLGHKDQTQTPHDATAIGSDHRAPHHSQLLTRLDQCLLTLWSEHKESSDLGLSTVIRCLGYISIDDEEFESWLVTHLANNMPDPQCVLHASGLCSHDTGNIAKLIAFVFPKHQRGFSPGVNELKAVSQALRYRVDATKGLESEEAERVVQTCLQVFESGLGRGGSGYAFRWSSLIIVYLLRRRMFDSEFLEPDGATAVEAKELFRTAMARYQKGKLRPLGGSVDLPSALQQMIDYIDRKGSGDILMASE